MWRIGGKRHGGVGVSLDHFRHAAISPAQRTSCTRCAWMSSRAPGQEENTDYDESGDHSRCQRSAESEPSMVHRLVEEIANRRTKRTRENEGCPKQQHPRNIRRVVK